MVDHVLSVHVHNYTCKSHISMQIGKMQLQHAEYVLYKALVPEGFPEVGLTSTNYYSVV